MNNVHSEFARGSPKNTLPRGQCRRYRETISVMDQPLEKKLTFSCLTPCWATRPVELTVYSRKWLDTHFCCVGDQGD